MAKAEGSDHVYQLKITLRHIKPPVWRQVHVKDCSLARLHDIIQACMGWDDDHLHAFEVGGEEYGPPDPDGMTGALPEGRIQLSRIVAQGIEKFTYTYDFGDTWEHTIQVEKTLAPEPGARYPRCVAGARACPPEDCGGPWGYADFVESIRDPKHPEHEDRLEWIGGEFDPEAFDLEEVNEELR